MRKGHFVLRVRRPPPFKTEGFPTCGLVASWPDIELEVVTDDGERIEVTDVKRIAFDFNSEIPEALTVTVELYPKTLMVNLESIAVDVRVVEPPEEGKP